ncbi:NADAR family protein [Candidatus Pacearchaeota archaeon]|nr:NADAR family protein [Candidatus Pacearchaeota archaeon]
MLFRNEYWFLSNMYPIKIVDNNVTYNSTENYYQAHKTFSPKSHDEIAISSPFESKKLGRKVVLRKDWDDIKLKIMARAIVLKFTKNENLRKKLIETGNIEIVETNTWGDTYWGICNGTGRNELGKLLMKLRTKLTEE